MEISSLRCTKKNNLRITTDQLILEVMELMLAEDQYKLPLFRANRQIGYISFAELNRFLTHNSDKGMLFHKFNYSITSFLSLEKKW